MNKNIFKLVLFFFPFSLFGQTADTMSFEDQIFNITTFINTQHTKNKEKIFKQGTGFYFAELPDSINKQKEARVWLISNRHVLFPDEVHPDTIYINFRKRLKATNRIVWLQEKIGKDYITKNIKLNSDSRVDIAALEITSIINAINPEMIDMIPIFALTKKEIFSKSNEYKPEVGDEILAIGYPKGFYDEYNTFPIVKAGIISSKFGFPYNGLPYFLVDCKLFPGSSGSLILSKPKEVIISKGKPLILTRKGLLFLGVYSGNPFRVSQVVEFDDMTITKKDMFDSGAVWYADLIKELIGIK